LHGVTETSALVILVDGAVTIIVLSIAHAVVEGRITRSARVADSASNTRSDPRRGAQSNSTVGRHRGVLFVNLPVTVVIETVADAVISGRRAGGAAIIDYSTRAGCRSGR
jgi:hypothetical protein